MRTEVLGVGFDNINMEQALDRGMELIAEGGPHLVVTPNAEIVQIAHKDPEFMEIIGKADLVIPDGIGVIYAFWGAPSVPACPDVTMPPG